VGHLVGKDLYRELGKKIDGLTVRAPWSETLYAVLTEIYSPEEAEVFVGMPYTFASLGRIARCTGYPPTKLRSILESLAGKGLVIDLCFENGYRYMPSPLFIGIFEFTMMRTAPGADVAKIGRLFHEYLSEGKVVEANCRSGERVNVIRALPHEGTVEEHVEILDYEKASAIVAEKKRFALGICSCRHEKLHAGVKKCEVPLGVCSSFDGGADLLIRHNMAREVSQGEMLDTLARSRELGRVVSADKQHSACCCNVLQGVSRFGYPNMIVTSSFIAGADQTECRSCGACVEACPIDAVAMKPLAGRETGGLRPEVDAALCMGCGVCALSCPSDGMKLHRREQRVIHPETTFERVLLQCLERGTLQNQIFDDPGSLTQKVMRAVLGAFLRLPPVKRALMTDLLRSRFLGAMKAGVAAQGKANLTTM
jgi:ferredoxin